ncbi:MAG: error-prone DNA polymerase [Pseudomonadota bacterium]
MADKPTYFELDIRSNFSFLTGASHPEELVVSAKRLGMSGIGLADTNNVAGVVRAHMAAKQAELAYQPGARLVFLDETPDMLAYPKNRMGWGHLCRLLTKANLRGEKGAPMVLRDDVIAWGADIAFCVLPDYAQVMDGDRIATWLDKLRENFADNIFMGITPNYDGLEARAFDAAVILSRQINVPLMAAGGVLYHEPDRHMLADVLTAVRNHEPLTRAGYTLRANGERFMRDGTEMARLFARAPDVLDVTASFFDKLDFSLEELRYNYPDEPAGQSATPQAELERLAWLGAQKRYPDHVPERVKEQISHELKLIEELEYAPYFLTVYDIVRFAREQNILCQGRGSAANSTVCFCIGITEVDPALTDLLFERFISPERREPPDIDVDFEHERREEVIQYIYDKYGRDRAGLAATVITYRARSAAREVAKAFDMSEDITSAMAGTIWGWHSADLGERELRAAGLDPDDINTRNMLHMATQIMGFPRHLSQHVGGFVITRDRLDEVIPISKSAMDGRTIVEWDKDDLDSLGILKIDILALGMLTCLKKAFDLLTLHYDRKLSLASMPKEDGRVYDMICRADTLGVFQIESRAQMTMLPRLRPREFYDLVIEVAIVRPGPIQGDMVHPYLRRRQGKEPVSYPSKKLEEVLGKTLGVPLFQEQAMKIAIVAADFSPGEADRLRRAMATFRRVGTIHTFQRKMVEGMVANGYEADFAERCFKQIEGFGEYGFPESHAASFALLVYASCWLKAFYPDVFCAAILNAQPMGFYAPSQLVRDAREHGVDVRAVDINASDWDCTLEPTDDDDGDFTTRLSHRHCSMRDVICTSHAVRLGFRQVKGLSEEALRLVVEKRGDGYDSVRDFWLRTALPVSQIERLADADAFRSLGLDRRTALWAVRALTPDRDKDSLPLLESMNADHKSEHIGVEIAGEPETQLPSMPLGEHVVHDYRFLGLSLKAHPVSFLRARLARERGVIEHEKLDHVKQNRRVTVAGLVLVRQRPGSAKGVIFATLEDETGVSNIIVWPKVFERFRPLVLGARMIAVTGRVQSEGGVIHIVAERIEDLTPWMENIEDPDFGYQGLDRADEVRSPVMDAREKLKPRSRLARLLREMPDLKEDYLAARRTRSVHGVLPKGRNFH